MKATLKIAVNQSRLIANLGSVFSNNTKVLAELMQNARRAGATRIDIAQRDDALVVSDDGEGIYDFQKLLTLAESGWDKEVMIEEGPFGMGFFSALFSANKVIVSSNGKKIEIDCKKDFLEQEISVLASDVMKGTCVELLGCQISNLEQNLLEYCAGFAVDVYLNGSADRVPSPHRLSADFRPCEVGQIRANLRDRHKYSEFSGRQYMAYLQGFLIGSNTGHSYWSDKDITIIHLDSASFSARMPDRDNLVNPKEGFERINLAVTNFWKQELIALKKSKPREIFGYHPMIKDLGFLEIFNDLDFLPTAYFGKLTLPVKNADFRDCQIKCPTDSLNGPILKKGEADQRLILKGDPTGVNNADHPYAMALMMALHVSGASILARAMHPNHWIYGFTKAIPDLSDYDYTLDGEAGTPVKVSYPTPIKAGKWSGLDVLLVDHYDLTIPEIGLAAKVDSQLGLALGCDDCGGWNPGILLMPKDSDADVLDQANNWIDGNDSYDERWASDEKGSLNAYLRVLRGQDLATVLLDLLNDTDVIIREALADQKFSVTFDEKGRAIVEHESNLVC